ncbi:MAG: putative Ig domain-containing protein [Desulfosoma sp.]
MRFDPPQPVTGDTLRAVVDFGKGGEPTDSSLVVRWTVNGKELEQTGETLEHDLVYGDFVTATAELMGTGNQPRRVSASVVVGNAPPVVSVLDETLKEGEFSATVDIRDPEGDPVIVDLSEGPEGMFWNDEMKAIQWRPAPSQRGVFHVKLEAKDPAGNAGAYSFDVTVTEPEGGAPSREGTRP